MFSVSDTSVHGKRKLNGNLYLESCLVDRSKRSQKSEELQCADSRSEIVKQDDATPYFNRYTSFNTCITATLTGTDRFSSYCVTRLRNEEIFTFVMTSGEL